MFRYLAVIWDPRDICGTSDVQRRTSTLLASPDWREAAASPGLRIFVTGDDGRANAATHLPDGSVVLGRLFPRGEAEQHPHIPCQDRHASHIRQAAGAVDLARDHWGRYVSFHPSDGGQVSVFRDPSGALPCFIQRHENLWIIFSWLEDLLTYLPEIRPRVDWGAITGLLAAGQLGGRETALDGITQLLPGELVRFAGSTEHRSCIWNAVDWARRPSIEDPSEAASAIRSTVMSCTAALAECYDRLLLRLSGGLDSSILASCLRPERVGTTVHCLNYFSAGANSDERPYARLAADAAQLKLIEMERDPSFRIGSILQAARMPTPVNYVARMGSARADALLARRLGASALFTGGGGDEAFLELSSWWPAADYLHRHGWSLQAAPVMLDAARLAQLSVWETLRLAAGSRGPTSAEESLLIPLCPLLHESITTTAPRELVKFFHPALSAASDVPIGKLRHLQFLLGPVGYYDPLEQSRAPELVNPLLMQPIVELCLQIPTYVLSLGGRSRGLVRTAFARDIPSAISTRRSKGGMEEHIELILRRNLDFVRTLLLDGKLARQGLLNIAKVEEALSRRPSALDMSIGEIHWLLGIEAWLQRWPTEGSAGDSSTVPGLPHHAEESL